MPFNIGSILGGVRSMFRHLLSQREARMKARPDGDQETFRRMILAPK